jgi:hypothetical protein
MTLITAWITPEFRIVASDSLLTDKNNNPLDENYRKVFSNNIVGVGLYGGLSPANRNTLEDFLNNNPEVQKDELIQKVETMFTDKKPGENQVDLQDSDVTHMLIVSKIGVPEILCIQHESKPYRHELDEYKMANQKKLPPDIFFSEQYINDEIDFKHQDELLTHFNFLINERNNGSLHVKVQNLPSEMEIIINFYLDVTNKKNENLKRNNIGGNQIYFAYSFNEENWKEGKYFINESIKPLTDEEFLKNLSKLQPNEK